MTQMAATPPDRTARAQHLARTYGGDRDGWERVEEYQRVQQWRDEHPERGSSAASTALNLPRGRIRSWFDGSAPEPAQAVETADDYGWLDCQPGDRMWEALSVLSAWVLAGGSIIEQTHVPRFTVSEGDPESLLVDALDAVGTGAAVARESEAQRSKELRPASDAPILGRFLTAVFDAPAGAKTAAVVRVPEPLDAAPRDSQLRWARTYVCLRGTPTGEAGSGRLLKEAGRSQQYWNALGGLFAGLVGDSHISIQEDSLYLDAQAAAVLAVVPDLPIRELRIQQLAETFGPENTWQRVQDYRRVQTYKEAHPEAGSWTIADALGFDDPDYIQGWVYGSEPNLVKAIATADSHGWLECRPGDRVFESLSVLSAWILAGGSINSRTWTPDWVTTNRPTDLLVAALDAAGVGAAPAAADTLEAATSVRPASDGALLGRVLHSVFGSPVGVKVHAGLRVPAWLDDCPRATRRRWARTYVVVRGIGLSYGPGRQILEVNRPDGYHDALVALFRDVVDDTDGLSQGEDAIYLRGPVCDALDVVPDLPK